MGCLGCLLGRLGEGGGGWRVVWGVTEEGEEHAMPNVAPPPPPGPRRRAERLPWSGDGGGATSLPQRGGYGPRALFWAPWLAALGGARRQRGCGAWGVVGMLHPSGALFVRAAVRGRWRIGG